MRDFSLSIDTNHFPRSLASLVKANKEPSFVQVWLTTLSISQFDPTVASGNIFTQVS